MRYLGCLALPLLGVARGRAAPPRPPDPALVERARKILDRVPLDRRPQRPALGVPQAVPEPPATRSTCERTPRKLDPPMHTDIPRLRKGGVGGQFWSVYVPVEITGRGRPSRRRWSRSTSSTGWSSATPTPSRWPTTADDVDAHPQGRQDRLADRHGGRALDRQLARRRCAMLYAAGARYMTLTHSKNTDWADSATDEPQHGGLTPLRRGGGARDEPARHAGGPLARLGRDDEEGARRLRRRR